MSVFLRKTSAGETKEYHYRFQQDGKRHVGVCEGCTTEKAARDYEAEQKRHVKNAAREKSVVAIYENRRKELTGGRDIKLADAMELMLLKPHKRDRSQKVIDQKRSFWRDWMAFVAATYPTLENLHDVSRQHAEAYIAHIQRSGRFDKTIEMTVGIRGGKTRKRTIERQYYLSNRTIVKIGQTLKEVFERLKADAGLINNPFDGVVMPAQKSTSRDAFSDDDLRAIAKHMTMPYIKPIFTIGLCTGLTLGDICLLRWDEINDGWIDNKRRRKTGAMLDIPIMPPLAALLDELSQGEQGEFVAPELAKMYQQNPSGVYYRVRKFLEGIDIQTTIRPDIPDSADPANDKGALRRRAIANKAAHAMRHTFAYLAGVYEVPLPIAQSVLGHMSPEMTKLYQRHANRADKERFFRQMPDILGSPARQIAEVDPERAELKRLADELPLETVRKLLKDFCSP